MELRDKLNHLKTENGYTTEVLSELSGVPKGTINKLLNGETRNPTTQTLARLADALGCPLDALMTPPQEIPGVYRLGAPLPKHPNLVPVVRKRIPLLGTIAAGKPIYAEQEYAYADCGVMAACDFALRVQGDSMIGARIHDGDLVFIRRQDDVDDGRIAAVLIDDEVTLKRVYHTKNGLTLISENPAYAPMVFTFEEHNVIRILGLAVGFHSNL